MTATDAPASPPNPSADLLERPLPLATLPPSADWWRTHSADHGPKFFGPAPRVPPKHRFDAPDGEYGMLYLCESLAACFAERLLRQRRGALIAKSRVEATAISAAQILRPLQVVRLHGDGLARIGATAASIDGGYDRSRRWALALWQHPAQADGLLYRSRWDNDLICLALFDRAEDAICFPWDAVPIEHHPDFGATLDRYEIGISID